MFHIPSLFHTIKLFLIPYLEHSFTKAKTKKIKYFENNFPNDEDYKEIQFTSYPANLQKKITILQHFNKHLKAGVCKSETMPYIKK